MSNTKSIERQARMHEKLSHITTLRKAWREAQESLEVELRLKLNEALDARRNAVMSAVYRELQENVPKADLARALMVSRPTLDRWLADYLGQDSVKKEFEDQLNPPPPRYSIESNTYDNRPPHMQFQITDNETGKTELLEPQHPVGNWKFGKLETVRGDEIPAEVMALVPDTEEEAYAMADEKTQLFWRRNWSTTLKLDG